MNWGEILAIYLPDKSFVSKNNLYNAFNCDVRRNKIILNKVCDNA